MHAHVGMCSREDIISFVNIRCGILYIEFIKNGTEDRGIKSQTI